MKGAGATGPWDEVLLLGRGLDEDDPVVEEIGSLVVVVSVVDDPTAPCPAPLPALPIVDRISKVNVGDLNTSVQRKVLKRSPAN